MTRTVALLLCLAPVVFGARVEERQTIRKTFPAAGRLEVDNVNGEVRVKGSDARQIRVTAHETIAADTKEQIEQARREVTLDIAGTGDKVRVYVDGPFRKSGRRPRPGYEFRYDIEIEAPRDSAIRLRAVNGGIDVDGIAAGYDVKSVNGRVEMTGMAGSGRVYSLNGGVKVYFRGNPREKSYFGSLNGPVDLYFQPDLSADLHMKTFNGAIYSDFPCTALPAAAEVKRRGAKTVYRAGRSSMRIGAGGPEFELENFNGDIRILLWEGVK